jgi:hypothetical protein
VLWGGRPYVDGQFGSLEDRLASAALKFCADLRRIFDAEEIPTVPSRRHRRVRRMPSTHPDRSRSPLARARARARRARRRLKLLAVGGR